MLGYSKVGLILILGYAFSVVSGYASAHTEGNLRIIKDFGACMSKFSRIKKGEICGAYVPWGKGISDLTECLLKPKIIHEEIDYDEIGNVYEISFQLKCGTKNISVIITNAGHPDDLFVKSVAEIVN